MSKSAIYKRFDFPHLIIAFVLCCWGLIVAYPFYNSLVISFVSQEAYIKTPLLLFPRKFDFSNYEFVFHWKTMLYGIRTTVIITIIGTLYNLFLTISTAYALTKPIPGKKLFNYMIIFTMYFTGGLIPYYLLIKSLHLGNTYFVMILPTGINIMYMLIMQSYFRTLPQGMEESAKIDGANDITILLKIILPLCMPMIATITLFYSVDRWNEWWLGMLFIRNIKLWPLQLVVRDMLVSTRALEEAIPESQRGAVFPLGLQLATIMVTILPIICFYPFLQKYFVKGLTLGSVKA